MRWLITALEIALSHRTHGTKYIKIPKNSWRSRGNMNERIKRFSIVAAIFLLSLVPIEISFSQEQSQLIKPCMAETTPEKKEDTTNTTKKKGRKRQKTKEKKDRNDQQQAKGSNCN